MFAIHLFEDVNATRATFQLLSSRDKDTFTGGIVKMLIKKEKRLGVDSEVHLDFKGVPVADQDVLAKKFSDGSTLALTILKAGLSSESTSPFDGEVFTKPFESSTILLYSPLQSHSHVGRGFPKNELFWLKSNFKTPLIPIGGGKEHEVSFGLDFLKENVMAYVVEGGSVWFWMSDSSVRQHTLVEKKTKNLASQKEKFDLVEDEKKKELAEQLEGATKREEALLEVVSTLSKTLLATQREKEEIKEELKKKSEDMEAQ